MTLQSQRAESTASSGLLPAFAGGWGPAAHEARSAYFRARQAGMNSLRSLVVSFCASFKDCWAFRRQIAHIIGCSVRTVQRALTQAQDLGLLRCARAKLGEVPPGAKRPIDCGFSHRWIMGWGVAGKRAGEKIRAAIERARMRRVLRVVVPAPKARRNPMEPKPQTWRQRRIPSLEELNAELERIERERESTSRGS